MTSPASSSNSYRPDIQGLRAVAIALVVLGHMGVSGFSGGFVGVDVFFVLSGYLITGLLLNEQRAAGRIHYWRFLARRLRRLLPALLVMLVVTLAIASFVLSDYETRMQAGSFSFSATWSSNFFFAFVERDYFSELQSEDLFLHTWSLGVEEQFYIVWPWLLSLAYLLRPSDVKERDMHRLALIALAVLFASSLYLSHYWTSYRPLLSFYMMPARGWQFALGAAVYVAYNFGAAERSEPRPYETYIRWLGLILIVGSAHYLNSEMTYPGFYALLPSIGAVMVIAAGVRNAGADVTLASRPCVWLGDRSYSLYLWHWPVLILGNAFGALASAAGVIALITISILLAMVSYRYVELPFWKGSLSKAPPLRTIAYSFAAVLIAVVGSASLQHDSDIGSNPLAVSQHYDPRNDALPAIYRTGLGCDTGHFGTQLVPCGIGNKDGEKLAVLLGDSIGAQWATLVTGLFPSPEWQVIVLTKSACAIVDEPYYYEKVGAEYTVCEEWRNGALDYIAELKPDIVVVGSSAGYDFSEAQWVAGTSRVLSRLSAAANDVFVISGTPKLTFNGPSCLEEPYRFSLRLRGGSRECEEMLVSSRSKDVSGYLSRAAADYPNARLLDLNDLVCPEDRCAAATRSGLVIFRDSQHLTMSFVDSLVPLARERFFSRP